MADEDETLNRRQRAATFRFFASFLDRLTVALWAIAVLGPIFGISPTGMGGLDLWFIAAGFLLGLVTLANAIMLTRAAVRMEQP